MSGASDGAITRLARRSYEPEVLEAVLVRQDTDDEAAHEPGFHFAELLRRLRRRFSLIVACTLVVTAIGVAATLSVTPRYRAEVVLLVDPRHERISNIQEVVSTLPLQEAALRSEIDVLRSRSLIEQIVRKAGLATIPEFNPELEKDVGLPWKMLFWLEPERQAELKQQVSDLISSVRNLIIPADEKTETVTDPVIIAAERYAKNLEVWTDGRSFTIKLSVDSRDPALAARLANMHAELYVADQFERKVQATERANRWLSEHVQRLKGDVQRAETAVQRYRAENQLIASGISGNADVTILKQQLAELNTHLTDARADSAHAAARLQQVRDLIRTGGDLNSVPEVLQSPTIQALHEQETHLRRLEAEAAARYRGDNHPVIIGARAQLRDVRARIDDEIQKIAASLQKSLEVARERERNLEQAVAAAIQRAASADMAEVKLADLEREAEATRTLYRTFLNRLKETSVGPASNMAEARVISFATIPRSPAFPMYMPFFAASFVLAAATGTGLALLLEALQDRLRSPTEFRKFFGVPGLGLVPRVRSRLGRWTPIADRIFNPNGRMSRDAVRATLEALTAAAGWKRPCSIVVTSAGPREGKTTLAIWLARTSATAGYKVLLVDADWRKPMVEKYLRAGRRDGQGGPAEPSADGRGEHERAVRVDPVTGMHYMTCPETTPGASSLQQIEGLLAGATAAYDLVFFDTAPPVAAPEMLPIFRMVDGVALAVRWGCTPRKQVGATIDMLRTLGANVLGAVVTCADVRRHRKYGFGDTGDVYYRCRRYYGQQVLALPRPAKAAAGPDPQGAGS